ncbi:hypothetical protein ABIC98_002291 [Arthrobacter nitrophenolicus]|uniref:Uncharacterized protein n=1 Tax=Arthrobacter nitrophenolicus TaxID=683150 RepID=A0ACC6TG48_9MICC
MSRHGTPGLGVRLRLARAAPILPCRGPGAVRPRRSGPSTPQRSPAALGGGKPPLLAAAGVDGRDPTRSAFGALPGMRHAAYVIGKIDVEHLTRVVSPRKGRGKSCRGSSVLHRSRHLGLASDGDGIWIRQQQPTRASLSSFGIWTIPNPRKYLGDRASLYLPRCYWVYRAASPTAGPQSWVRFVCLPQSPRTSRYNSPLRAKYLWTRLGPNRLSPKLVLA